MNVLAVIVAAIVGYLGGRMLWLAMRSSWNTPTLMRENFRKISVPTAGGFIFGITLVAVEGIRGVFGAFGVGEGEGLSAARAAVIIVVLGFSVLGLLDDLVGDSKHKGLAGHLKALGRGELTTGGLKFIGGIAVALAGASFVSDAGTLGLVLDAAIIALAANFANSLDLRPGRTSKVAITAFVLMAVISGFEASLVPVAIVAGAAAALLLDEMHERVMLGDTGANALGAAIGLGLVVTTSGTGRIITVVALLALNLLCEFVSLTKVIEKVGALRALDEMGRRRTGSSGKAQPKVDRQPAVDLREPARPYAQDEDDIDLPPAMRPTMSPSRGTVEGAHVGAATGSRLSREQSAFPPAESGERAATRSFSSEDRFAADDDDLGSSSRNWDQPAPRSEARRSPFGDDEF